MTTEGGDSLAWRLYGYGRPIKEALEVLAPPEVKAKFDELRWGNVLLHEYDPFWTKQRAKFYNLFNLVAPSVAALALSRSAASTKRASQLSALYDLEIAYVGGLPYYPVLGFVSPRGIKDEPVQLPPDAWEGSRFDWDTETVKCGSLTMERLRLVDLKAVPSDLAQEWEGSPEVKAQAAASPVRRAKPGRKSTKDAIYEAVDQLASDEAFLNAQKKVQLDRVLALIQGKDPALDALLASGKDKTHKGHIATRLAERRGGR